MTADEVTAVDAKIATSPTEVEFAFAAGISHGIPSVPESSIKVAGLAAEGPTYVAVIKVRRPYGEANTVVSELDTVNDETYSVEESEGKGALVEIPVIPYGVTYALSLLGVTVALTDVTVKSSIVFVYPNRDKVPALPLPEKASGLPTTEPDNLTSGEKESANYTMVFVGVGVVIVIIVLVAVGILVMKKGRGNTQVASAPSPYTHPAASEEPQPAPSEEPPA
jgi:hypothetical protein